MWALWACLLHECEPYHFRALCAREDNIIKTQLGPNSASGVGASRSGAHATGSGTHGRAWGRAVTSTPRRDGTPPRGGAGLAGSLTACRHRANGPASSWAGHSHDALLPVSQHGPTQTVPAHACSSSSSAPLEELLGEGHWWSCSLHRWTPHWLSASALSHWLKACALSHWLSASALSRWLKAYWSASPLSPWLKACALSRWREALGLSRKLASFTLPHWRLVPP